MAPAAAPPWPSTNLPTDTRLGAQGAKASRRRRGRRARITARRRGRVPVHYARANSRPYPLPHRLTDLPSVPCLTLEALGHSRQEVPPQRGQRPKEEQRRSRIRTHFRLEAGRTSAVRRRPAGSEVAESRHAQRSLDPTLASCAWSSGARKTGELGSLQAARRVLKLK